MEHKNVIEQIDALTFGKETSKLVDFVRIPPASKLTGSVLAEMSPSCQSFIVFMLDRERVKQNGFLKL